MIALAYHDDYRNEDARSYCLQREDFSIVIAPCDMWNAKQRWWNPRGAVWIQEPEDDFAEGPSRVPEQSVEEFTLPIRIDFAEKGGFGSPPAQTDRLAPEAPGREDAEAVPCGAWKKRVDSGWRSGSQACFQILIMRRIWSNYF